CSSDLPAVPRIAQRTTISPRVMPPRPGSRRPAAAPARKKRRGFNKWLVITPLLTLAFLVMSTCAALTLGAGVIYSSGILPGVRVAGISLGGLSQEEAAEQLRTTWKSLLLRDGERTWTINPAVLGIRLDAEATARAAHRQGRDEGSPLQAIFGSVDVPPVVSIDMVQAAVALNELTGRIDLPAVNAGVRLVNGRVEATPPQEGRRLDVVQLLSRLDNGGVAAEVADGVIDLPMRRVQPAITDSTPMLALARDLLANPLRIEAFDPIDNERYNWSLPPE